MTGRPGGTAATGEAAPGGTALLLAPRTVSWFPAGFAVIAAVWLTLDSAQGDWIALAALAAGYAAARAGRAMAGPAPPAGVAWSLASGAVLSEFIVYAGMAAAVSLHPGAAVPAGPMAGALHGTVAAGLGGAGPAGVWRLAVTAVILSAIQPVAAMCRHGTARGSSWRAFGFPGDVRLPLAGAVVLLAGERAAFVVVLVLGVAAIGTTVTGGARAGWSPAGWQGYRGDGWLAVRVGGFVGGRLPPMPPLLAGLLVTGVLAPLGLRNLPGILVLTPVEAMLLAALGSGHPHRGRGDWLVPPLLHAAEYLFIAEAGFASRLWPAVTFALVAAIGLRHLQLACRACGGLASGADRRGLGWEGRMIVAGVAAAAGIQVAVYPVLALLLWGLTINDWPADRSARHTTVDR